VQKEDTEVTADEIKQQLPSLQDFVDCAYKLLPELRRNVCPLYQYVFQICDTLSAQQALKTWACSFGRNWRCPCDPQTSPSAGPDADRIALIQYTSGSIGQPKGAMLTQGGITRKGFGTGERMGLTSDDRLFAPNPFFHVAGTVTALMNAVTHRATLVTMEHYEPGGALALLEQEGCTGRRARHYVPT
jgi:long-subunit acyl-CoA synthetase (AMP-forming)